MKSLVEAAASIFKAIEKGWHRAGCPQEFTVKVLEEAETNFLGITRKPAKIALFFMDNNQQPLKNNTPRISKELPDNPQPQQPPKKADTEDNRNRRRRPSHHEKHPHKDRRDRRFDKRYERPIRDEKPKEQVPAQPRKEVSHNTLKENKPTSGTLFRSTHRKTSSHPVRNNQEELRIPSKPNSSSDEGK